MRRLDPGRALLAVALALALWVVVQNEQNPERTGVPGFDVPVDVINTPPGLVATGLPQPIQLRVRAPADVYTRLKSTSFRAVADASRAQPGVNRLPVRVDRQDPDVRSVEPIPAVVDVQFEQLRERAVPVRVKVAGNVPFGYTYATPRAVPDTVTVTGPASLVERVDAALVELSLDRVTVSVNATYAVRPVDSRGEDVRNLRVNPSTVVVEVPVTQQLSYKSVGIRPVVTGRPAAGYYLEPLEVDPASATVVGEPTALASVNFVDTEPVDVNGASSTVVRQVQLVTPRGLSLVHSGPVTVTVRVSALTVTQSFRLPPTLIGLGQGLVPPEALPLIDLRVTGPAPALQGLNRRDFRVELDVTDLGPGRYEVAPRVSIPEGLTLEAVEPATVVVELRPPPTSTPTPSGTPTPAPAPSPTAPPGATPSPSDGAD